MNWNCNMKASILVRAERDSEAGVWVATSDDVPGLVTEVETPDKLQRKLLVMIPELLELNDNLIHEFPPEVPVFIASQQVIKVRLRARMNDYGKAVRQAIEDGC